MFRNRMISSALALVFAVLCMPVSMMARGQSGDPSPAGPEIQGERLETTPGIAQSTSAIMQRQVSMPQVLMWRPQYEHEIELDNLQPNPDAPAVSTWPPNAPKFLGAMRPLASQTTALSFDGANSNDTNATPPDSMGTIGPSQYIVFVNGRLRSFNKTGVADGVLNVSPDTFFASVMTPVGGSVVLSFTSDPQIRYDRFTARWYLSIIDVPCTDSNCNGTAPNRWLLAVSDAASKGTITASTVWTFFYVSTDTTNFCDYPSLGIDVNALYFGCNMFGASFAGTNGYVVQKSSVQGAGPMVVTKFASLGTASSGMYTPRGVDNFDATATVGYFIGADAGFYSRINFRRVSNPGSTAPTISANIQITTPTTGATNPVEHLGNTGGNNGRLDSLDHRLFQAMIRNGHLWTAHNLRVNASGVANTGAAARKAARWYDFTMSDSSNPVLNQSGTVYDSASTLAASAQYWIPSIAATGQGHAVIGFSKAGTPFGATPSYTGRLSGDPLGTMSGVPGASMTNIGVTAAGYNPSWDDGSQNGSRRWGDYSFTVVDPLDDMTVWTVQEYNEATNMYAVRVAKLLAPPPATPTCSASPISFQSGTGNVTITGTSTNGSGFYDPGANLPSPALPFTHISASVTNATVNSVTYNSPTQVTLNITASIPGSQNVTIVNPDGQGVTANGCINVSAPVATKLAFTAQPPSSSASGSAFTATVTVQDASGNTMTSDNSNVALALAGGTSGANLSGTLIVQAVNGVAAFSGLSVDKAGTGYTLHATDGSLTPADSNSFNIVAGAAAAISFTTQPATNANVTAGSPITLVAHVVDGAGNAVAGESVALAIASGFAGSTLTATSPQTTNASGDATFSNVSLNKVGTGTLSATDGVLVATSNSFNIVAGAAAAISFTTQPATNANVTAGSPITLVAHVVDGAGNAVAGESVALAIASGFAGSTLTATSPQTTNASGDATFSNVSLNKVGTGTLSATDGVLVATSNSFNIVAGAAAAISFTTQPATNANVTAGSPITLVAHVVDGAGNAVAGESVALAIASGFAGSTLTATSPQTTNASGDATFSNVSLNKVGTGTLSATDGVLVATSNSFNIVAGAAAAISFTTQPATNANVTAGSPITLVAHVVDGAGNAVAGESVALAIASGFAGSTLTATSPQTTNASGDATFSNVSLNKVGTGTLSATDGVLVATSNSFNIVASSPDHLTFTPAPGDIVQGQTLGNVTVTEYDAYGNQITADSTTQVSLVAGQCGGTVLGTQALNGGAVTFNTTQAFLTVTTNPASLSAAAGSNPPTPASSTFNVMLGDEIFFNGFESCTP